MKTFTIAIILPFALVNGGIFKDIMKPGCDFDRETSSYVCLKITTQFPKMYYGEYNLQCLYCDIEIFTNDTFPYKNRLRVFNVSESKISTINSKAFQNLKYLEQIHLENNKIVDINEDAFYSLRRLFELRLEHNLISSLKPGFLNQCEANALVMHHNKLVELPNDVFQGMHSIFILDISYNYLTTLHVDSLKHLNGLEVLNLEHNGLCSLPIGVFKHLKNLRSLNIAHNNFSSFPLGIFSPLTSLANLNISSNNLRVFESKMLLPLRRISLLDISANSLRDLNPVSVKQYMPTLQWIVLNDNFWTCSDLTFIVQYFSNNRVDVSDYGMQRFDLMNINGIACLESELSEDVTLTQFLNLVDSVTMNKDYCFAN